MLDRGVLGVVVKKGLIGCHDGRLLRHYLHPVYVFPAPVLLSCLPPVEFGVEFQLSASAVVLFLQKLQGLHSFFFGRSVYFHSSHEILNFSPIFFNFFLFLQPVQTFFCKLLDEFSLPWMIEELQFRELFDSIDVVKVIESAGGDAVIFHNRNKALLCHFNIKIIKKILYHYMVMFLPLKVRNVGSSCSYLTRP